jgi:hypothetical protein
MTLNSFYFASFLIGYVCNRFARQLLDILCSYWWQEALCIVISVCVCFLYIANSSFVSSRYILRCRKLTELWSSFFCCEFYVGLFVKFY